MDELIQLTHKEQQYLWRALEAAVAVRHRGQFFLWTQGQLQALLPHGVMVCLSFDQSHQIVHHECMQGLPLDKAVVDALSDRDAGVLARVALHMREADLSQVVMAEQDDSPRHPLQSFREVFRNLGLGHVMFQSTGPLPGGGSSLFALLMLGDAPSARHELLLQVLLPQLHLAFCRSQVYRLDQREPQVDLDEEGLTDRQLEILHWVKLGKTNFEISQILGISALTVKNHMQKMFKKLNVHNRAQAVAKSMAMQFNQRSLM